MIDKWYKLFRCKVSVSGSHVWRANKDRYSQKRCDKNEERYEGILSIVKVEWLKVYDEGL